jgi:hypothetical protein
MAAGQGASLRELTERMGHSSARAALIYQHATRNETRPSRRAWASCYARRRKARTAAGGASTESPSGTQRARGRKRAETDDHALDLRRGGESGRRESNPHDQLGRLGLYH